MAFEGVSASGGEGWFPQHPKTGPWETLKGSTLAPHTAAPLEGDKPTNTTRGSGGTITSHWDSNVVVTTGKTGGGGTMLK